MAQAISEKAVLNMTTNVAESPASERKPRYKNIIHLWEFLLELLADESCRSLITWSREAHGEFKLKNQEEVAKRWGKLKRRPNMNYEKLSRALRHYYSQGIIKKVEGQRLVYKFHKLPYEYTPGKTRSQDGKEKPPAPTVQRDQYLKGISPYSSSLPGKDRVRLKLLKERANGEDAQIKRADYSMQEEDISSSSATVITPESIPSLLQPKCHPIYPMIPVHLPTYTTYICNQCQLGGPSMWENHGSRLLFPMAPQMYSQFGGFAPVSVIRHR